MQALLKIGYVLNMMEFLKMSSLINLLLESEVPNIDKNAVFQDKIPT